MLNDVGRSLDNRISLVKIFCLERGGDSEAAHSREFGGGDAEGCILDDEARERRYSQLFGAPQKRLRIWFAPRAFVRGHKGVERVEKRFGRGIEQAAAHAPRDKANLEALATKLRYQGLHTWIEREAVVRLVVRVFCCTNARSSLGIFAVTSQDSGSEFRSFLALEEATFGSLGGDAVFRKGGLPRSKVIVDRVADHAVKVEQNRPYLRCHEPARC